jgi:hypothetical protein
MRRLLLLATFGLLLVAAPTAAADPTVTFTDSSTSAKWRQGFFTGSVRFTIETTEPATVFVFVRRRSGKGPVLASKQLDLVPGTPVTETIKLPPQPKPGEYRLRASLVTPAGNIGLPTERRVVIPSPPEGVVAKAVVSRQRGGANVTSVSGGVSQMWVRFRFLALPRKGLQKKVIWFSPSAQIVGTVVKSDQFVVDSFIRNRNGVLPRGNWEARLVIGGVIARRTFVRIR